jgi:glucan phosphoethanolaminetransferase (alkaline phosphatase superfamily)
MKSLLQRLVQGWRHERASLAWLLLGVSLIALPNWLSLGWPRLQPARVLPIMHGIALLLLPVALGLRAVTWLRWCLPLLLVMPMVAAYYAVTLNLPHEWAVLALQEANASEMMQFLPAVLAALVLIPLLGWWYWRYLLAKVPSDYRPTSVVRVVILALVVVLPAKDLLTAGLSWGGKVIRDRLVNLYPFGTAIAMWNGTQLRMEIGSRATKANQFDVEPAPATSEREVHIVVLGESARFDSFQLNGYDRETNPRLIKRSGMIAFSNVSAPATITLQSVPLLLTDATPASLPEAIHRPSILSVFNKAGYDVHWLSTQRKHGMWDTTCSVYSDDADSSQFLSGKLAASLKHYSSAMDMELLPKVSEILSKAGPRVLLVLHTMGSHYQYPDRYPPSHNHFPADRVICDQALSQGIVTEEHKLHMTNAYDNTVRYTDELLDSLITLVDQPKTLATVTFISDHGENSAQAPMLACAHGIPTHDVLHIPMFVWLSKDYEAARGSQTQSLRANREASLAGGTLFHTLIEMADLKASVLQPTLSAASSQLASMSRKVITLDGALLDYDADVLAKINKRGGWAPLPRPSSPTNRP